MTLNFLVMGAAGFGWGSLSDRYGSRPVVLAGAILLGLALVLASRMTTIVGFQLVYGILVGLAAGAFFAPMIATATAWFTTNRSLAVSLVSAGMGVAPMTISPFAGWLLTTYDWRTAMAVIGVVAVASFAWNVHQAASDPVGTFYSPQSRFWELLLGAWLAYLALDKRNVFVRLLERIRPHLNGRITIGEGRRRELSAAGGAVPVLLSASSWDPLAETMDAWVVRMLATAYYNGRTETPDRLLRRGLLLRVELPGVRRQVVQARLGEHEVRRPLVIVDVLARPHFL